MLSWISIKFKFVIRQIWVLFFNEWSKYVCNICITFSSLPSSHVQNISPQSRSKKCYSYAMPPDANALNPYFKLNYAKLPFLFGWDCSSKSSAVLCRYVSDSLANNAFVIRGERWKQTSNDIPFALLNATRDTSIDLFVSIPQKREKVFPVYWVICWLQDSR